MAGYNTQILQILMKLLLSLMIGLAVMPAFAQQPALSIAAKSFLLTDFQTGQVLASQNAHERAEPASLTKLMTARLRVTNSREEKVSR